MAKIHTHYDNLKVARNAPPEVIRAAYKTLSQRYHPDRHPGDAAATRTFQIIHAAYEVLSDPVRRKEHDEWIERTESAESDAPPAAEIPAAEAARFRTFDDYAGRPGSALKAVAATLKGQSTEQRVFTYVLCSLIATLILFLILAE